MTIRLVLFDALHTLVTPRAPIFLQYANVFEPHLGELNPDAIKSSFKIALKQVQIERPAYSSGAPEWWGEVITRTALGAGADPALVEGSMHVIVPTLLKRFSSDEGYKSFDDAIPTLTRLREMNVRIGLVSNTDSRMLQALDALKILSFLNPVLVSGNEGIEKPAAEIYLRACERARVDPAETIHVGDELQADYFGASAVGIKALLVRRPGADGEEEHKESGEDLTGVSVVHGLSEVVDEVLRSRSDVQSFQSSA
ncbi:HAD hydrolase subfamily IA REG-2-like protein [Thelephora terrestris]|uniref:HAD hydrolase subfamily IA REG-2-like protein n=1 Tax=Thelephora terrestris TaxID=56493 RepID=A0A9P6LDZ6_9AGAM|nr:HAD hydrolase subfamily IA REG-2-like protein [Thelephora terrestris]